MSSSRFNIVLIQMRTTLSKFDSNRDTRGLLNIIHTFNLIQVKYEPGIVLVEVVQELWDVALTSQQQYGFLLMSVINSKPTHRLHQLTAKLFTTHNQYQTMNSHLTKMTTPPTILYVHLSLSMLLFLLENKNISSPQQSFNFML